MNEHGWRLGPHRYLPVVLLPGADAGCTWAVVRRDGEGPRALLQLWQPCPPARVLDSLKEAFLQCFSQADALDPGACHLGFDPNQAWFLQELGGTSLPRLWAQTDEAGRRGLKERIAEALAGSRAPRLALPQVIGLDPGRVLAPRLLGGTGPEPDLGGRLGREAGTGSAERPWDEPPEFAGARTPLRGRMRELTYLKSLILGLGAAIPMERVLILQGEEGLGHDRLCDWAGAVAETEGLWVADLDVYPGEAAGGLLERLLAELLAGLEADLYAAQPGVARALSRRMAAFAFLGGGRREASGQRPLDARETDAVMAAMAFAQARQPRLVLIRSLERAGADIPPMLHQLVAGAELPWLVSARDLDLGPEAKACLDGLRLDPAAATIILDRLEDGAIAEVLTDLLGPHDLPPGVLAQLGAASLGNPGLLRKTLELAQAQGCILLREGRWTGDLDRIPELPRDLMAGILQGRLHRLRPAARLAVRQLALADGPLAVPILGRSLGLDGDGLEEALHGAAGARLALVADGCARIASPQAREQALAGMTGPEIREGAQVLLRAMADQGGRPLLAVRLQALALDRAAALAKVLEGVERERTSPLEVERTSPLEAERTSPLEAERIVREAQMLSPDPFQQARLQEFQADAWDGVSFPLALEALARARAILDAAPGGWRRDEASARLQRKQALLELRLGRLEAAQASIQRAGALLADHPFHPEQPRLRLALGRLQLSRGEREAQATLGSGLELLARKEPESDPRDQAELGLELGWAQGEAAQFQGAMATLEPVRRLAEQQGDRRMLARVLGVQGQIRLGMGQTEAAGQGLQEALLLARSLDDQALLAECHLAQGLFHSGRQLLGPALASLDSALVGFESLGDGPGAARAQAWKARNLTALGEPGQAELLLLRVAGAGAPLTPVQLAERVFLDGEIAGFMDAWGAARRHYQAAANRMAHAGLVWRERLARLRCIQAAAQEAPMGARADLDPAWMRLEQLKEPVAGSGSHWLELEWRRAHALLLGSGGGPDRAAALTAWGEVLAGARELKLPALVLEAATRCAERLLDQDGRLEARARIQDALPSAQELWANLPPSSGRSFLDRNDLHRFRRAAERAGVSLPWPEPDPTAIDPV
jgi:hypothetical protein